MAKHKLSLNLEIEVDEDPDSDGIFLVEYEEPEHHQNLVIKKVEKVVGCKVDLLDVGEFHSGHIQLVFQKK